MPSGGRRPARSGPAGVRAGASLGELLGVGLALGAQGDAVAEPDRAHLLEAGGLGQRLARGRPIDRPRPRLPAGQGFSASRAAMWRSSTRSSGVGAVSQEENLAALALGLLQQLARDLDPLAPIPRRGPAIVDDQEQRPAAAEAGGGVQDRPGQGENQECRDGQAQQQEPPGRARWRALAG